LGGKIVVISTSRDRTSRNRDQTEIIGFLEVLVNNATRPNRGHLTAVESLNFGECSWFHLIATILSEEDGHIVGCKLSCALVVTRQSVAGVTTPRIDVVAPEINSLRSITTTVEVGSNELSNTGVIRCSIANTNRSVTLALIYAFMSRTAALTKALALVFVLLLVTSFPAKKPRVLV